MMEPDRTMVFLCIYDHGRFGAGTLAELVAPHGVDVSPELARLVRVGYLAASRVLPGPVLRLCGELDFECADAVAGVLDAHYHGTLRLDLADLSYVDLDGLRALRGTKGQQLTLTAASQPVRRLLELLGWDTDPRIEIAEAA
jgi:anti-anti-sigma regulatory factor